ncbi:MAG: amidohydrolase family protein, partial [Alphaproteobacteria bacterium]|nr:amidohydrolase family protein [Alphaproteobacteria bacterium]
MAVIDVHTHMMSPVWVEAIGKDETYGLTEVNGKRMIALGGRPYMPVEDEMLDYDRRIKDMDAAGVDLAIISLTTPSVYWADQAEAARLSRTVNDEMADRQRAFPDRLRFFATLPWQYPEEAVTELVRTLELGAVGVFVGANLEGLSLTDASLAPVWEAIDARALPV